MPRNPDIARLAWPSRSRDPTRAAVERPIVCSRKYGDTELQPFKTQYGKGRTFFRCQIVAVRRYSALGPKTEIDLLIGL